MMLSRSYFAPGKAESAVLIKTLCSQDLEPEKQRILVREAFMKHWAAIGALHVILSNMEAAIAPVSHFQPIEHGMEMYLEPHSPGRIRRLSVTCAR